MGADDRFYFNESARCSVNPVVIDRLSVADRAADVDQALEDRSSSQHCSVAQLAVDLIRWKLRTVRGPNRTRAGYSLPMAECLADGIENSGVPKQSNGSPANPARLAATERRLCSRPFFSRQVLALVHSRSGRLWRRSAGIPLSGGRARRAPIVLGPESRSSRAAERSQDPPRVADAIGAAAALAPAHEISQGFHCSRLISPCPV